MPPSSSLRVYDPTPSLVVWSLPALIAASRSSIRCAISSTVILSTYMWQVSWVQDPSSVHGSLLVKTSVEILLNLVVIVSSISSTALIKSFASGLGNYGGSRQISHPRWISSRSYESKSFNILQQHANVRPRIRCPVPAWPFLLWWCGRQGVQAGAFRSLRNLNIGNRGRTGCKLDRKYESFTVLYHLCAAPCSSWSSVSALWACKYESSAVPPGRRFHGQPDTTIGLGLYPDFLQNFELSSFHLIINTLSIIHYFSEIGLKQ